MINVSWQLRLEPNHIASVLSKLTLSPAYSENILNIYIYGTFRTKHGIYIYKIKKINKKIKKIKHRHTKKTTTNKQKKILHIKETIII